MEEENARLKKTIGNQALELEFKTGLLKKAGCLRAEAEGLVKAYILKGIAARGGLRWSEIRPSSFYYKKSGGAKGMKPSIHSIGRDGALFENTAVVKDIEKTLHQEFCCYGYKNMTGELKERDWIINHKKVYRLMKEHKLLFRGKIRLNLSGGILSALERLELKGPCSTCQWILNTCMCMVGKETFFF